MKLVPPGAKALTPPENPFKNGALVMYENDGSPYVGAIAGFKKDKYLIQNMRGKDVELPPFRLHPLPGALPGHVMVTIRTRIDYLLALYEKAVAAQGEIALRTLWEKVKSEDKPRTVPELAALLFDEISVERYLSLRLALLADRVFFKRAEDSFAPRPENVVAELQRSEEAQNKKLHALNITLAAFAARLTNPKAPLPDEARHFIELLEDTAAGTEELEHSRQKEAKELINSFSEREKITLSSSREKRALQILQRIGHFTEDTNLALIRHRPPLAFSKEATAEAALLAERENIAKVIRADGQMRTDLTHLKPITIDDRTTKDMDDALSLDQTQDGYELGIHISDVAALIPPDSLVDKESRIRATSMYLAGKPINMLPDSLAEFGCSLVAGEIRPATSLLFTVSRDFTIQSMRVFPSVIKVAQRLSYIEADQLLDSGDRLLNDLYQISSCLEMARVDAGAFRVTKKEAIIGISDDGALNLQEIDEEDPSRAMIAEFMVLANAELAKFAAENKLPVLFRGQEKPYDEQGQSVAPTGPASDFERRTRLKRSTTGFSPLPHSGLGLKAYIQASSPIRRYVDLCNQRQLLWFFRTGKPFYTLAEYETLMGEVAPGLARGGQISKETRRFYALKYLAQMAQRKEPITGTIVRLDNRTPLVELDTVHMTVLARVKNSARLGDKIQLTAIAIDPQMDVLRLEQV